MPPRGPLTSLGHCGKIPYSRDAHTPRRQFFDTTSNLWPIMSQTPRSTWPLGYIADLPPDDRIIHYLCDIQAAQSEIEYLQWQRDTFTTTCEVRGKYYDTLEPLLARIATCNYVITNRRQRIANLET